MRNRTGTHRRGRTEAQTLARGLLLAALMFTPLLLARTHTAARAADASAPRPELVLQTGHAMRVDALAFSPDARLVASGSADNTVRLWDSATGRELRRLTGHTLYVRAAAFSPDGRTLASGSMDKSVRVWDVASGRETKILLDVGGTVSLAFSADGRTLAAGTAEGNVKLFDARAWGEPRPFVGHKNQVTALAFSADGGTLASGAKDGAVKLWDAAAGRELRALEGHTGLVKSLAFSSDGKTLASASFDGGVKIWNASDGRESRTLRLGDGLKATAVAFAPDGRALLAASSDRSVRSFDTTSWTQTRESRGVVNNEDAEAPSEVAAFSADAKQIVTSNGDKTIQLRDLNSDAAARVFESYSSGVYATAFSPDRHWFATAGKDKTVRVWEIATGRKVRTLTGHTGWVTSLAFDSDSTLLASASLSGQVKLWNNETGLEERTLAGHTEGVNSVAFSADGKTLASASGDSTVKLWDVATGRETLTLKGHESEVNAVAFSTDGKTIASGGADKTVRLWDAVSGKQTRELKSTGEVFGVAFSPDGGALAFAAGDGSVKLYDANGTAELRSLAGHEGGVRAVAFSPDGRRVATASADATARLWDAETGRELSRLSEHTDAVNGVAFSPDGAWLATGSEDGSTRVWDTKTGAQAATLVSTTDARDWLVATPDGLFDGSPAAWQQIVWRFDGDTRSFAPVEAFFNEFFYPDLLADILAGKRPPAAQDIARIDRRQPVVKISPESAADTINTRNLKLKIEVTDAPAGARDLRLFRNGSLVYVRRGAIEAGGAALEATVPVVAGENVFTAYAFNRDNVKSADARTTVRGDEKLRRAPTTYIVAVGVNTYANPRYNLKFSAADANSFVDEVKRQRSLVEPKGRIEAVTLLDADATKANILTALRRLAGADAPALPASAPKSLEALKPAEPEDVVLVYFAGHGTAQRNRFYLIPHDIGYMGEREIKSELSLQTILNHSVSDEELEKLFEPINAGQVVLVLDACNSGQALEAEEQRRGPMNSRGLAQLAYEKGMYVLTAAQSYQAALEAAQLGHGLLTYALVQEGLQKGEADSRAAHDGRIVVREWFDFAAERVPRMRFEQVKQARGIRVARVTADVQRPRTFYRRELDAQPLVIAKPERSF